MPLKPEHTKIIRKWSLIAAGVLLAVAISLGWLYSINPNLAEFFAYLLGGILIFFQIGVSSYRATVAEKTAEAMQKTAESTEKGNVAERFKNAIEHLSYESASVRLGGIYALHHIAQEEENYCKRVFEILCAHVRETTTHENYKPAVLITTEKGDSLKGPTIEIQSILDLLFVKKISRAIYTNLNANLEYANLEGASLVSADLTSAILNFANLERSFLMSADLSNAMLSFARLEGIVLNNGNLNNAKFMGADLKRSSLLEVENLTIEQLSKARYLYRAKIKTKIPSDMESVLRKKHPELFKDPGAKTDP